ncbi:hypothetical protein, partial [uncultured Bilophila sp.]|uniref:hypothetical protein n=1 Tax=uncultured Bilophila sp. TaxID=529385 RepID=UPI00280BBD92
YRHWLTVGAQSFQVDLGGHFAVYGWMSSRRKVGIESYVGKYFAEGGHYDEEAIRAVLQAETEDWDAVPS